MTESDEEQRFQDQLEKLDRRVDRFSLSDHFSVYTRLECKFCGYTTGRLEAMKTHVVTMHVEEVEAGIDG